MSGAAHRDLLLGALRDPSCLDGLDPRAWSELLPAARRAGVLARLAHLAREHAMEDRLLPRVRQQLAAARPAAEQHARVVRWEVDRIRHALSGLDVRLVLLKGAAYVCADLPAARGRLASDVDILVPKDRIADVEQALVANGFRSVKLHPYDQRYYRTWSHELPPLRHERRRSVVDVHHSIAPLTGRVHPDPRKLLAAVEPIDGQRLWILAPEDLVLHSTTHLFQDGDLAGGLRDLTDLDALLRDFDARRPEIWDRLLPRARELGLTRPLYYGLAFCRRLLGTPVPEAVWTAVERAGRPPWPVGGWMDRLALHALCPDRDDRRTRGVQLARLTLYVRSHWLRMPPWLLAYHLTRKAARAWAPWDDEAQ